MSDQSQIIYRTPADQPDHQAIGIDQFWKRKVQRRRRVAKRMLKRAPLFAVEFMQEEFPEITQEQFIADVTRKTRKRKSQRKNKKTPMVRQGRWPLYRKAMADYQVTGDQKYLIQAQEMRNRMYQRFRVTATLNGERRAWDYPSTSSVEMIQKIAALKFESWEEFDELEEAIRERYQIRG
jgi:hypothetical protein